MRNGSALWTSLAVLILTIAGYAQTQPDFKQDIEQCLNAQTPKPVSYTHLDVYKRQLL